MIDLSDLKELISRIEEEYGEFLGIKNIYLDEDGDSESITIKYWNNNGFIKESKLSKKIIE